MRIPSFSVQNQRSIKFAKCDAVPPLMVIVGPNGTGKSTLLHAVRSNAGPNNIIYLGPHRAMRRQQVQERHLMSTTFSFQDLLARSDAPSFEGVQMIAGSRDPWGHDDSVNYLKHSLCQVETDFQRAISDRYRRDGEIKKGAVADPWGPLRELCSSLLPHLSFHGIDSGNRDQIRCLWKVHRSPQPVDLDELSSGEKSIIQMFFPLVERKVRRLLAEVAGKQSDQPQPDVCVLVDEPELHLHPNLQVKVLDYFRMLSYGPGTQIIIATHSPTIVEAASFEELFLLRPLELVPEGENQLVQVADNEDRLEALRNLFGGTSNLTSMQPVIVVEGVREQDSQNVCADRKLYRTLHPDFDRVTLVPAGGKSECIALIRGLKEAIKTLSPDLKAVALLDRDKASTVDDEQGGVFHLPVTMIENFLLDPDSMWEAMQSVVEKTSLRSPADIAAGIAQVLDAIEPDEIERRARDSLGASIFHPSKPLSEVPDKAANFSSQVVARYSAPAVEQARTNATKEVEALKAKPSRREAFHGKDVLNRFYGAHLMKVGLPKTIFVFETGRHARKRKAVKEFFDRFFDRLLEKSVMADDFDDPATKPPQ